MYVWVLVSFLVVSGEDVRSFVALAESEQDCQQHVARLKAQVPQAQSYCVRLRRNDV